MLEEYSTYGDRIQELNAKINDALADKEKTQERLMIDLKARIEGVKANDKKGFA